jgi:hypothetical protein
MLLAIAAPAARADDGEPPVQHPRALPSTADLDDDYLWLGPIGAAVEIEGVWDSAFGAEIAVVRVRERRGLTAAGLALGATRYSKRDGGRIWFEGLAGTRRLPGHALLGVTAGPAVELGTLEHPRMGFTGSVWAFVGVTPYVRAGWFVEAGSFVELGLTIALPVLRR